MIRRVYGYISERFEPYRSEVIITNSRFNAARIRHNGRVEVINPPVQLPSTIQAEKNGELLTVARLKSSKNLNKIAEIAVKSRNRFNVAGRTEYGSARLISELRDYRNIEVYVNPRRERVIELMNRCSIYLSTQPDEAFGIAVVEAMSLGCIPLVYRGGGPWRDILEESEECVLAYSTSDEAVEKIRDVLMDEDRRRTLRKNGIVRAQSFTTSVFRKRFTEFMNTLEPKEHQEHRIYSWYRKMKSFRKSVRDRVSILVPV